MSYVWTWLPSPSLSTLQRSILLQLSYVLSKPEQGLQLAVYFCTREKETVPVTVVNQSLSLSFPLSLSLSPTSLRIDQCLVLITGGSKAPLIEHK